MSFASAMRHRIRYSIGAAPTVSVKRALKLERDSPASRASPRDRARGARRRQHRHVQPQRRGRAPGRRGGRRISRGDPPLVAKTALGRIGEADDGGAAIAALLCDDCRWVTGQAIEVSGGFRL
jgi:NAD(P)-dependent dehydrogenase (short-subunit alcohol dehydrogenase family)